MNAEDISSGYSGFVVMRRWGATWIDFVILALVVAVLPNQLPEGPRPFAQILALVVAVLYYPVLEGYTGRTIGKWLLRIKVVNLYGQPPGLGAGVVRTLLRLFEVNPILLGGLPAGLFALFSRTKQRAGDMLAGTYVLRDEDLHRVTLR